MVKRTFSREFKLQVVRQLSRGEKRLAQLCREYGLCQTLVRRWREQYETAGENAWLNQQEAASASLEPAQRIAALEAALGRAHLEIDFLRHSLEVVRKGGSRSTNNGH
jgi:transposase-like protein